MLAGYWEWQKLLCCCVCRASQTSWENLQEDGRCDGERAGRKELKKRWKMMFKEARRGDSGDGYEGEKEARLTPCPFYLLCMFPQ